MIEHAQLVAFHCDDGQVIVHCQCGESFSSYRGEYDARRMCAQHIEDASDRVTPQTSDAGGTAAASPPGAAGRSPLSWKRETRTFAFCTECAWNHAGEIAKSLAENHAYEERHSVAIQRTTNLSVVNPSDGPSFTSTKVRH